MAVRPSDEVAACRSVVGPSEWARDGPRAAHALLSVQSCIWRVGLSGRPASGRLDRVAMPVVACAFLPGRGDRRHQPHHHPSAEEPGRV